jgi:hypothetical protein
MQDYAVPSTGDFSVYTNTRTDRAMNYVRQHLVFRGGRGREREWKRGGAKDKQPLQGQSRTQSHEIATGLHISRP